MSAYPVEFASQVNSIFSSFIFVANNVQFLYATVLSEKLQLLGIDVDKNAIQRIESGQRFVTDIELLGFKLVFNVSFDVLLQTTVE
jgi:hypothetical protein